MNLGKFYFKPASSKEYNLYARVIYGYVFLEFIIQLRSGYTKETSLWDPISFFKLLPEIYWQKIVPLAQVLMLLSALFAFTGILSNYARKICFSSFLIYVGYFMNYGKVFHGYHLLAVTLGVLSFGPCPKHDKQVVYTWEYYWPILTIKLYAISIYFTNGLRKLLFSSEYWLDGSILYSILYGLPGKNVIAQYLLELAMPLFQLSSFFLVIVIQLMSPLALMGKRLSYLYFALFFVFHLATILVLGNHVEFFSYVICNLVFLINYKDIS